MTVKTVTLEQILFKVAEDLKETKSGFVTHRTSDTVFRCGGLTNTTDDFYNYGLMREVGGSTIVTITDYAGTNREFTVGSGLTVAVGDQMEFCWWNADKRNTAIAASNEAIRMSWDFFHREVVVEAASSGITFAAGDDDYDLPEACDALLEIGVGANPISWFPPVEQNGQLNWRTEGQPGALVLRLAEKFNRVGTIADNYPSQGAALHYRTREAEIAPGGTTQLPLNYFTVAAWIYARQALNKASRLDLQTASVNIPQLEQAARMEIERLSVGKLLPSLLMAQGQEEAQSKGNK